MFANFCNRKQPLQQISHRERGYSLLELLAALTILSLTALALTKSSVTSLSSTNRAIRHSIATLLATDKLEELLAKDPLTLTEQSSETETNLTASNGAFNRTTTITINGDGARRIAIAVTPLQPNLGGSASLESVLPLRGAN